jgi:hypothetical protein
VTPDALHAPKIGELSNRPRLQFSNNRFVAFALQLLLPKRRIGAPLSAEEFCNDDLLPLICPTRQVNFVKSKI